jgi:hypothetical protein
MKVRFLFRAVAYWQLFEAGVRRRTAAQYSSANMMVNSFWRRSVEVDMISEDVIYHGSRVRTPNNNARGRMLRDQFGNYRRNLSEMAKSMARHIKNNNPRTSLHHASPILGKIRSYGEPQTRNIPLQIEP